MACRGISSLSGLKVTATGWVHIAGQHVVRKDLAQLLRSHGATLQQEFNLETHLVILGDWRNHQLQDDRIGGVDAIEQVALSREQQGPHVHLLRQDDLSALLRGERVPCRQVPRDWMAMQKNARRVTVRKRPYQ